MKRIPTYFLPSNEITHLVLEQSIPKALMLANAKIYFIWLMKRIWGSAGVRRQSRNEHKVSSKKEEGEKRIKRFEHISYSLYLLIL